jgi:hypothetical protein
MSHQLQAPATLPMGKILIPTEQKARWAPVGPNILQEQNISSPCQVSNRDRPARNLLLYNSTILDPIDELLGQE